MAGYLQHLPSSTGANRRSEIDGLAVGRPSIVVESEDSSRRLPRIDANLGTVWYLTDDWRRHTQRRHRAAFFAVDLTLALALSLVILFGRVGVEIIAGPNEAAVSERETSTSNLEIWNLEAQSNLTGS